MFVSIKITEIIEKSKDDRVVEVRSLRNVADEMPYYRQMNVTS